MTTSGISVVAASPQKTCPGRIASIFAQDDRRSSTLVFFLGDSYTLAPHDQPNFGLRCSRVGESRSGRAKGAAKGTAGGAAIGADDEAGKGAAAGAAAGTMVGGAKQRKANKASKQQAAQATAQQQQQQEAEAKATYQQGIDTFKRAFSACMDARGYSIK